MVIDINENKCGECTVCCTVLPISWLNKPANTPCKHCLVGGGCNVHLTKDSECKDFNCAYIQSGNTHVELRPDNCGIMFERLSDNIFYGTVVPGVEVTETGKNQIRSFNNQGYSVVLFSFKEPKPLLFLNNDHRKDSIEEEFNKHLRSLEQYGSSNIRN